MHVGNINKGTAAGRLYRVLRLHLGEWTDAFVLAQEARTTCLSTRIAEVRKQVEPEYELTHKEEIVSGQRLQYYRMANGSAA